MPARHARPAPSSAAKVQGALLATLGALALLRGVAASLPGHWLWSLDLFRWSLPWTWGLWLASALVLLPAVGEWIDAPAVAWGRRLEHGWLAPLVCAGLAAGLVLLFPDRLHYVGDSLIRADAVSEGLPAR